MKVAPADLPRAGAGVVDPRPEVAREPEDPRVPLERGLGVQRELKKAGERKINREPLNPQGKTLPPVRIPQILLQLLHPR